MSGREICQDLSPTKRGANWAALTGKLGTAKIRTNFLNALVKPLVGDDEVIGVAENRWALRDSGLGVRLGKRGSVVLEEEAAVELRGNGRSRISGRKESVRNFREFFRDLEEKKTSDKVRSILGLGKEGGGGRERGETSYSTILRN